jgi:hypothetical protein
MPATADTPLSSQLATMESLIAAGDAFQAWVEAADETEAKESIFPVGVLPADGRASFTKEELSGMRPFAVVDFDKADGGFQFPNIAQGQFSPKGRILLFFEDNVLAEDKRNLKEATYAFLNQVGAVISEMLENAETGPYHVIRGYSLRSGPRRATPEEAATRGDHMIVILSLDVGLE